MAKFKSHLLRLVSQKQEEVGHIITRAEIIRETGLSGTTVDRWLKGDLGSVEPEAVLKFCAWLGCEMKDLVEPVNEGSVLPTHTHLAAVPTTA